MNIIGSLRESSLHASLKQLYAPPEGVHESPVGGYLADVAGNDHLVEIQTGSFSKIRRKLASLLAGHRVLLVHPIAAEKRLTVYDGSLKEVLYSRRSPKRGMIIDAVYQLVYIPNLLTHPNFTLEVVLTREEEIRAADGTGSWRRRGIRIVDRRLVEVLTKERFSLPVDYLGLLPCRLPPSFTNRELSRVSGIPMDKIGKLTYCFRSMGLIRETGREGNALVFAPACR